MLKRIYYVLSYLGRPPWDTGISPPELMAFIRDHPPGRALDLGCGTGTNAITLAEHGWKVVGVDFVSNAIRTAKTKARRTGVEVDFHLGDVTRLEGISGQFDLILDIGCFHSLSKSRRESYIHNLDRLLSRGGTFLLYAFLQQENQSDTGITRKDLSMIGTVLELISQADGTERGQRHSAWFTFQYRDSVISNRS